MKTTNNKTNDSENNKNKDLLLNMPTGKYEVTAATAGVIDCLRAGQNYFQMICDALHARYKDTHTAEQIDEMANQYLKPLLEVSDMLHLEITQAVVDAIGSKNTAAVFRI